MNKRTSQANYNGQVMNIPATPTDNLYKYLTVLGTFVVMVSIYSFSQVVDSHDQRIRETAGQFLVGEQVEKEFWIPYLLQQKRNSESAMSFLIGTIITGSLFAISGAVFWYLKLQRTEDCKIRVELLRLKKLELELGNSVPES